ncbi:MAG: Rieske 2Fe-2S domain-containing protein [Verrucomicrobiae bacterium]|nr:Rieske 2Fe-2S domain-containing protein [Verrucomicrobiae bacterium]
MQISRRHFLLLTAGLAGGCATGEDAGIPAGPRSLNVGPAGNYATDGVYQKFRDEGFFIVRQGGKLFALSAICTHRKCKLTAKLDGSFYCPCHGSTFDPAGHVTEGPAQRDLPVFEALPNEQGQIVVNIPSL